MKRDPMVSLRRHYEQNAERAPDRLDQIIGARSRKKGEQASLCGGVAAGFVAAAALILALARPMPNDKDAPLPHELLERQIASAGLGTQADSSGPRTEATSWRA